MFKFGKNKKSAAIYEQLGKVQMNLENNYKDEAHHEMKILVEMFENAKDNNEISQKDIQRINDKIKIYEQKLTDYGHNKHVGW